MAWERFTLEPREKQSRQFLETVKVEKGPALIPGRPAEKILEFSIIG
jgi:hypothetical protein